MIYLGLAPQNLQRKISVKLRIKTPSGLHTKKIGAIGASKKGNLKIRPAMHMLLKKALIFKF